jgi:hypothetical protein
MRVILIVFAILLVLLTFLGAFGGSIYQKEPFFSNNSPDMDMTDSEFTYPGLPKESYENTEDDDLIMENMQNMQNSQSMPPTPPMPPMPEGPKDEFYNVPSNMPKSSPMILEEQPKRFLEDGFNIEPFEDEAPTSSMPAMY